MCELYAVAAARGRNVLVVLAAKAIVDPANASCSESHVSQISNTWPL